jgi:hypothetical protein
VCGESRTHGDNGGDGKTQFGCASCPYPLSRSAGSAAWQFCGGGGAPGGSGRFPAYRLQGLARLFFGDTGNKGGVTLHRELPLLRIVAISPRAEQTWPGPTLLVHAVLYSYWVPVTIRVKNSRIAEQVESPSIPPAWR